MMLKKTLPVLFCIALAQFPSGGGSHGNQDLDFASFEEWQQLEREQREVERKILQWQATPSRDPSFLFGLNDDPQNEGKNRYNNVKPLEHSRLKLRDTDSDYFNGNWINGIHSQAPHNYIATQAPLPSTFEDFWHAVWQEHSLIIVMLTQLKEQGYKKADRYWPKSHPLIFGNYRVTLLSEESHEECIIRQLELKKLNTNETRIIHHIQCIWPDMGVPSNSMMVSLLGHIDRLNENIDQTFNHPLTVHCSAGLGRAGTFILIHTLVNHIKESKIDFSEMDFASVLRKLRTQRHGTVQTWDQYRFAKNFVSYYVSSILEEEESVEVPLSRSQMKRKRNSATPPNRVKKMKVDQPDMTDSMDSDPQQQIEL